MFRVDGFSISRFGTCGRSIVLLGGVSLLVVGASAPTASWAEDAGRIRLAQATKPAPDKKAPDKPAATGTPAAAPAAPVDAWAVNCSNQAGGVFACEMVQAIVDGNSRTVVMRISISKPPQPGLPAVLFRAVHGVYLPSGLTVNVDGKKPTKLDFQKSDGSGVYAAWPLSNEIVAELKKGTELVLEAEMNKDQKLTLKAPLRGFGPAFDRVVSTN